MRGGEGGGVLFSLHKYERGAKLFALIEIVEIRPYTPRNERKSPWQHPDNR